MSFGDGGNGADEIILSGNGPIVAEFDMDNLISVDKFLNSSALGGNRSITFSPVAETTE